MVLCLEGSTDVRGKGMIGLYIPYWIAKKCITLLCTKASQSTVNYRELLYLRDAHGRHGAITIERARSGDA